MRMCVWDMAPLNRMTRPCAVVPLNRMPNRMYRYVTAWTYKLMTFDDYFRLAVLYRVWMNVCVSILTCRLTSPPALSTHIVFTHTVLPPICSAVRVQSCLTEDLPMKGLALASDCHVRPAWFRCRPVGPSWGFAFSPAELYKH